MINSALFYFLSLLFFFSIFSFIFLLDFYFYFYLRQGSVMWQLYISQGMTDCDTEKTIEDSGADDVI